MYQTSKSKYSYKPPREVNISVISNSHKQTLLQQKFHAESAPDDTEIISSTPASEVGSEKIVD